MLRISQFAAFRRRLTAVCLVGGSLLGLAASVLARPPGTQDAAATLAGVRAQGGSFLLQVLLELAGFVLTFGGAIGATQVLRRRGVVLGNLAAIFAALGLAGFAVVDAMGLMLYALSGGSDRAAMTAAAAAVQSGPALMVSLPLILLGEVGLVLLAAGLRRARLVPVWVPVAVGLAAVVDFFGTSRATLVATSVLGLAAFTWVARVLLASDDELWGQPGLAVPVATVAQPA